MEILKGFNRLLLPEESFCLFCNTETEDKKGHMCPDCRNNIEYLNREIDLNSSYLKKVISSLFYNQFIREKLYLYKYEGFGYFYKPLGEILIKTIYEKISIDDIDIITYVPIHRRRKAIRGYNQSELIAKYLSQRLNIPISSKELVRTKWTKAQNKLSKESRMKNMQGVFKVRDNRNIEDKKILIIDDIITTGATIKECARILLKEGKAREVYALSITSGIKL